MGNVSLDQDAMDILEKWRAVLRRNGRRRASFSDALKHLEGMAATRRI